MRQGWAALLRTAGLVRSIEAITVVLEVDTGSVRAIDHKHREAGGDLLDQIEFPIPKTALTGPFHVEPNF